MPRAVRLTIMILVLALLVPGALATGGSFAYRYVANVAQHGTDGETWGICCFNSVGERGAAGTATVTIDDDLLPSARIGWKTIVFHDPGNPCSEGEAEDVVVIEIPPSCELLVTHVILGTAGVVRASWTG